MIPVRPLTPLERLADVAMTPLMRLLGGLEADSVQETHRWHRQDIAPDSVRTDLAIRVRGDDGSWVKTNRTAPFPFFHAPVMGGWKTYVVLEVQAEDPAWHVGWRHVAAPAGARRIAAVHRLPIRDRRVRMLKQSEGFVTDFFAVAPDGRPLGLKRIADGRLGENRHADVRLF